MADRTSSIGRHPQPIQLNIAEEPGIKETGESGKTKTRVPKSARPQLSQKPAPSVDAVGTGSILNTEITGKGSDTQTEESSQPKVVPRSEAESESEQAIQRLHALKSKKLQQARQRHLAYLKSYFGNSDIVYSRDSLTQELELLNILKKMDARLDGAEFSSSRGVQLYLSQAPARKLVRDSGEFSETAVPLVMQMLDLGCDPNSRTAEGKTLLMLACANGNKEMVEYLLSQSERLQPELLDWHGKSAAMYAAENGDPEILQMLKDADIKMNPENETVPIYKELRDLISSKNSSNKQNSNLSTDDINRIHELIKRLTTQLMNDFEVNRRDASGKTLLMHAIDECDPTMVRIICRMIRGTNQHIEDAEGKSAFDYIDKIRDKVMREKISEIVFTRDRGISLAPADSIAFQKATTSDLATELSDEMLKAYMGNES